MRVTVDFDWSRVGDVFIASGKLRFPKVPDVPGIYRIGLAGIGDTREVYIGETDRLGRRLQHYRTPGPSQSTNIRLNALMLQVLQESGTVNVSTITEARVDVGEGPVPLRLANKTSRVLVESAALVAASESGETVLNL